MCVPASWFPVWSTNGKFCLTVEPWESHTHMPTRKTETRFAQRWQKNTHSLVWWKWKHQERDWHWWTDAWAVSNTTIMRENMLKCVVFFKRDMQRSIFLEIHLKIFLSGPLSSKWWTINIQSGLAVWFCSGQRLPAHLCSLSWISNNTPPPPPRVNRTEQSRYH